MEKKKKIQNLCVHTLGSYPIILFKEDIQLGKMHKNPSTSIASVIDYNNWITDGISCQLQITGQNSYGG